MPTKTIILGAFATAAIFAATAANAATPAVGATPIAPGATARLDRPDQRYCIVSDVTGSRIAHRECRQLGDWQDMGIDPRLMLRRR